MGWPAGHPIIVVCHFERSEKSRDDTITSFTNDLTLEVRGNIRDMYPSSIALPDELREAYLPLLLHLLYELEQATMVGLVASNNICRATKDMVTVLHTADERIELLASVSAADNYRLSPRFAYWV